MNAQEPSRPEILYLRMELRRLSWLIEGVETHRSSIMGPFTFSILSLLTDKSRRSELGPKYGAELWQASTGRRQ